MIKKLVYFIPVLLAVVLSGCGSSDAEILSIALEGATVIGTPEIDSIEKTVVINVETVDLSTVETIMSLSEGSQCAGSELSDGEGVIFTVTAENGAEQEWTVTVNVAEGVFFVYDDIPVYLQKGLVDTTDADNNQKLGNGHPAGNYLTTYYGSYLYITEDNYDAGTSSGTPVTDSLSIVFTGEPEDTTEQTLTLLTYSQGSAAVPPTSSEFDSSAESSVYIDTYGEVGEAISGSFAAKVTLDIDGVTSTVQVTRGYFKVIRIIDNTIGS